MKIFMFLCFTIIIIFAKHRRQGRGRLKNPCRHFSEVFALITIRIIDYSKKYCYNSHISVISTFSPGFIIQLIQAHSMPGTDALHGFP